MCSILQIVTRNLALAAMTGALCIQASAEVRYTFEKVARTGGPILGFSGYRIGLNDYGAISFAADMAQGNMGVFVCTQDSLHQIDVSGNEFRYFDPPQLNIHGTVVYKGQRPDGSQAVLRYYAGTRSILADSTDPRVGFFGPVSLTDNELTAFVGQYWRDDALPGEFRIGHTLFVADGSNVTSIADTAGDYSSIGYATINNLGDVTFGGQKDDGSGGAYLLTHNGQEYSNSMVGSSGNGPMSMNNSRQIASHGGTPANDQAIFVWQHLSVTTFADGSGPFDYVGFPDINDNGHLVFDASLDDFGGRGLFTGPDPTQDTVVRIGELLDGLAILEFRSYPQINNRGQIAFVVRMADGNESIYLATPVPEPLAATLAVISITVFFLFPRRVSIGR